ncbi:MAG: hypothetical protein IPJ74_26325 [Saprospiraceae bacterium]|nr:hypothetical protein [Saprospiraceae bacterium]
MATTGIINGTNLRIYRNGVAIAHAVTCTLDFTMEPRETLTKDLPGAGWTKIAPGRKSATLTTDGLIAYDSANETVMDLFDVFSADTLLALRFDTGGESGDPYWDGSGYCTALNMGATVEENATFSATFTVDGQVTRGTNS